MIVINNDPTNEYSTPKIVNKKNDIVNVIALSINNEYTYFEKNGIYLLKKYNTCM